jgi:hypothetical protein
MLVNLGISLLKLPSCKIFASDQLSFSVQEFGAAYLHSLITLYVYLRIARILVGVATVDRYGNIRGRTLPGTPMMAIAG